MKEIPTDLKVARAFLVLCCILFWLLGLGFFDRWLKPRQAHEARIDHWLK